ncbi:MAG: hypothetical protein JSS09_00420 [Verrucomicrobia bacterium]|nr:hypothetical protein [Verrucomicrobiota bacterium]
MARKIIFYILLIPLVLAILGDLCQKQTKGFWLQNVFSSYPSDFHPTPLSEEESILLPKLLKQPFYFMKKGQQCFTFLSKDGKYVLKLLRWEKLEPPFWTKWIPIKKSSSLIQERKRKKDFDFTSYKIAYTTLKEETGLLFLQLEPNPELDIPLEIYDNIGIKHLIKTSQVSFILQKKVENFAPYFTEKLSEKKPEDLYLFFSHLAKLLQNRFDRNIKDSDISIEYNMGILDGKPVLFDIGNLSYQENQISRKDFLREETRLIFATLYKKSPQLAQFLQNEIDQIIEQEPENIQ